MGSDQARQPTKRILRLVVYGAFATPLLLAGCQSGPAAAPTTAPEPGETQPQAASARPEPEEAEPQTPFARRLSKRFDLETLFSLEARPGKPGVAAFLTRSSGALESGTRFLVELRDFPSPERADRYLTLGGVPEQTAVPEGVLLIEQRGSRLVVVQLGDVAPPPEGSLALLHEVWNAAAEPGQPLPPVRTRMASFPDGSFVVDTVMQDPIFLRSFERIDELRTSPYARTHADDLRRVQYVCTQEDPATLAAYTNGFGLTSADTAALASEPDTPVTGETSDELPRLRRVLVRADWDSWSGTPVGDAASSRALLSGAFAAR